MSKMEVDDTVSDDVDLATYEVEMVIERVEKEWNKGRMLGVMFLRDEITPQCVSRVKDGGYRVNGGGTIDYEGEHEVCRPAWFISKKP